MINELSSYITGIDYAYIRTIIELYFKSSYQYFKVFLSDVENYLIDTVEHLILGFFLYVIICIILYLVVVKFNFIPCTKEMKNARRILFVIAHPDDEVMFFGPTILYYVNKPNCMVYLMCLSTGRNYGMDRIRINELYESCKVLGIQEGNIFIYDHTELPDSMTTRWPLEIVSKQVQYLVEVLSITNLITFDRHGISGHTNHCCIYYAIANLILDGRLPKHCGVFVLESINILRKYWLILDIPLSLILSKFWYIHGFKQKLQIHKAMSKHYSQLIWFRRLYMLFSRYTLINTLQQVNIFDVEFDLDDELTYF